jgi:phage baseplate assembly protein W
MANLERFLGAPYPITKDVRGLLHTQATLEQIKSDLLILLLTNPGERVMLPDFGTPLRELVFEPNDDALQEKAREMIIKSIRTWEPRITVDQISVSNSIDPDSLNPQDNRDEIGGILFIQIAFFDPENIKDVQQLTLEFPLGGTNA